MRSLRHVARSVALSLLAATACTEAAYDAQPDAAGGPNTCASGRCVDARSLRDAEATLVADAGVDARVDMQQPAPDDPITAALLGTYAVHTRFYGHELSTGLVQVLHEQISIARIERDGDALSMRLATCYDGGQLITAVGFSNGVRVKFPEHYPERKLQIAVSGTSFDTYGEPFTLGYGDSKCSVGTTSDADPANVWLGDGKCQCVGNVDAPPDATDDCRINDFDRDGKPGMTVAASGLINGDQYVRILDRSFYVQGTVVPGSKRHTASFSKNEDFRELRQPNAGPTPKYEFTQCPLPQNPASFVPLDDANIDCAEVVRRWQNSVLFPGEQLAGSFPKGC